MAKGSSGIGWAREAGPDMLVVRNEIRTSAEVPFVSTRGDFLIIVPVARSRVAMNDTRDAGRL